MNGPRSRFIQDKGTRRRIDISRPTAHQIAIRLFKINEIISRRKFRLFWDEWRDEWFAICWLTSIIDSNLIVNSIQSKPKGNNVSLEIRTRMWSVTTRGPGGKSYGSTSNQSTSIDPRLAGVVAGGQFDLNIDRPTHDAHPCPLKLSRIRQKRCCPPFSSILSQLYASPIACRCAPSTSSLLGTSQSQQLKVIANSTPTQWLFYTTPQFSSRKHFERHVLISSVYSFSSCQHKSWHRGPADKSQATLATVRLTRLYEMRKWRNRLIWDK